MINVLIHPIPKLFQDAEVSENNLGMHKLRGGGMNFKCNA